MFWQLLLLPSSGKNAIKRNILLIAFDQAALYPPRAWLKQVQLPKHCLYDTSDNNVRYLRYVVCQRLRRLRWYGVSCLKQNYLWFFFLSWVIWRPISKTVFVKRIFWCLLWHTVFLSGSEFLLMVIFLGDLICVLPKCIILLSSRRIYLPMFILEVTKQCVTLWFYKFQDWKFYNNSSTENQEKFRFKRWKVIITATDIEDLNGYSFILYIFRVLFVLSEKPMCKKWNNSGRIVNTSSVNKVMRLPAYRTIWQFCGLALHMNVR